MTYTSSLKDAEWAILEPMVSELNKKRPGQPCTRDLRKTVDGILYTLCTGGQWRNMPNDLPPEQDVYGQFRWWRDEGHWKTICLTLNRQARISQNWLGDASLMVMDKQTIQSAPGNSPRRKKGAAHP